MKLNQDIIYLINKLLNIKCKWCKKKIDVLTDNFIILNGVHFCDYYCFQWLYTNL